MPLRLAPQIDAYLRKKRSPLVGMGGVFAQAGAQYGVDPRLLVSIAGAETSLGSYGPSQRIHNPFGMGPGINYPSYAEAIRAAAKNLGLNYVKKGLDTIPEIQGKWAPSGASNDPTGLNNNWSRNVASYYQEMGGDPGVSAEIATYTATAADMESKFSGVGDPSATPPPALTAQQSQGIDALVARALPGTNTPNFASIGQPLGELTARLRNTPAPQPTQTHGLIQGMMQTQLKEQLTKNVTDAGLGLAVDHDQPLTASAAAYTGPLKDYMAQHPAAGSAITQGKSFLGTPYVWGGTTPKGFDCSGYVQYLYAKQGISLPRTTYQQIKSGQAVAMKNLMPGDIVFFGTKKDPHHEGLYIGNGQFMHAPHTGDVVKISSLNDGYYRQHFVTGRRVS